MDLFGCTSVKDAKDRLAAYILAHEGVGSREDWIRGVGWDQMALGEMPTAVCLALKISDTVSDSILFARPCLPTLTGFM